MGLWPASPLGLLREAATALHRLLAGNEVTVDGDHFRLDRIRLDHPPEDSVPLYFGVHGPASLRLSGELAEGTLLGWFSSPRYVAWARERIEEGRARTGREDPHRLVVLCLVSISEEDPIGARRAVGQWCGPMLVGMAGSPQMAASGRGDGLQAAVEREGPDAVAADPPDALLDEFLAAGTVADCTRAVGRLMAAGADGVVLVPNPAGFRSTDAMVEQMRTAARLIDRD
jgi:alkanesulfonate monooxygenase SsuD/methylene tetrahydromethanopterin reductase-like flavin-dependent oxidoreductase (luciferase family)